MAPMNKARVVRSADHVLEVMILPSARDQQRARLIRRAGGDIPAHLQPRRLGTFKLGRSDGLVLARQQANEKAEELAKQHNCSLRSLSKGQRSWVAHLMQKGS